MVYTIEFQKRGLPHAHICLFFSKNSKLPNPEDIDRVISAELPDKEEDPELYKLVSELMMHGPCGAYNMKSPCMKKDKCSKKFPKDYTEKTYINEDGYPVYKRRNDGRTVVKGKVHLDNR